MIFFLHVKILFTTCSLISFGASTIEIRGMIQLYFKIKDYSNKKYFTSQIVKINLTSMYIYIYPGCVDPSIREHFFREKYREKE